MHSQLRRNRWRPAIAGFVAFGALAACSAHSPFILKNTVDTVTARPVPLPPHQESVFVTEDNLDPSRYEVLAFIEVGRIWYDGSSRILVEMAKRAREIGADAVVDVDTWRQPSGFAWAAPHGSGKAVKFNDKDGIDLTGIDGDWL